MPSPSGDRIRTTAPQNDREFAVWENGRLQGHAETTREIERLRAAITWALGEGDSNFGDCVPDVPKHRYWWRAELKRRAGL